ncbi:alpha/beta fold hydrolase [Catelliglobosispora koreensis]|uniref:alpha/beta fold hydrolase n=1 Tax=Catelliglobosispora koreensis TaxID=129052 RepID=UPI00035D5251|nr:alpha/beta hydrolase [Catelliglobosispora koreensis]
MIEIQTQTLKVPGAVLTYDVRAVPGSSAPALLMIGSPMDASGFTDLAARFTDRTVVTYDPRGTARSTKDDPGSESTPDQHADDLSRLIRHLGGPADVFASSGGAVNGLALLAQHPELVRVLVAHEPPAAQALPDRDNALAALKRLRDLYEDKGFGYGMAGFIALADHRGEFPSDFGDGPPADPAELGTPAEDDGSRDDPLFAQNLISCTHYEPDFAALRQVKTRVVIGVGAESEGQMAYRAGLAVARRLGSEPVIFPSHHRGFIGEDPFMKGDPDAFAMVLRDVL